MIKIKIDQSDIKPYYLQIQEQIRELIVSGELSHGTKLLPAAKWAPLIGVNFRTLNRSLNNLTKEGLLYRRRRLGTFVNSELNKETIKKKKPSQSIILVFLPEKKRLSYPYTQEVIRGINFRSAYYHLGIKIKFIDNESISPQEKNIAGVIIDKEGFVNKDVLKLIEEYKCKTAFFSSNLSTHREIPSVVMDNEKGAYLATEYLIKKGHEKIAIFLRSNMFSQLNLQYSTDTNKLKSYKFALEKYDLGIKDEYQKSGVYNNSEKIKKAVEELLSLNSVPTAILSADDLIAFEILKVLNKKRH